MSGYFKRYITILSIFLLLGGCLPEEIYIEVEPAPSKLVVSSQVIPDNLMLVTVSRSFSALTDDNFEGLDEDFLNSLLIDRGLVTITYDNIVDTLFSDPDAPGVYISDFELQGDFQSFRLDVYDSTSEQSVHAFADLLPRVTLDSIYVGYDIAFGDTTTVFYYEFTDPSATNNWFEINIFAESDEVEQESFDFNGFNEYLLATEIISDQLIENNKYSNTITFSGGILTSDTVAFMLSNISEGYYRFLDTRIRAGGPFSSSLSEPSTYPTNVEDGYGYFNAHNPDIQFTTR